MPAVRGIDVTISAGETWRCSGRTAPASRRRSTCCSACSSRTAARCRSSAGRQTGRSTPARSGRCSRPAALIRDLSVRELVSMMASLYPRRSTSTRCSSSRASTPPRRRTQKLSGGRDPARSLRGRARQQPRPARPRRADGGDGRREPPRVLGDDARVRGPRQDRPVRHALPRGGRRVRRPGRADGARADRRRRPDDRDQGDGRHAHDPGDAAGRRSGRARSAPRRDARRAPRRGGRPQLHRLGRRDPRLPELPGRADIEISGAGSNRPSSSSPRPNDAGEAP